MFVSEPPTGTSNVQLNVTRGPGTFGQISVDYQVIFLCMIIYCISSI